MSPPSWSTVSECCSSASTSGGSELEELVVWGSKLGVGLAGLPQLRGLWPHGFGKESAANREWFLLVLILRYLNKFAVKDFSN